MNDLLKLVRNNVPALLFLGIVVYLALALQRINQHIDGSAHDGCAAEQGAADDVDHDTRRLRAARAVATLALLVSFVMLTRTLGGLFGQLSQAVAGRAENRSTSNFVMTLLLVALLVMLAVYLGGNTKCAGAGLLNNTWSIVLASVLGVVGGVVSLSRPANNGVAPTSAFSYKY